jgi:hypothetical protein
MPVIAEVAGIIKDIFLANMGMIIDQMQNVWIPLLTDLVIPIMMALIPVIKLVADMARDFLVPAMKILSGIMNFLMVNVVQPLIKWLSGGLVKAIESVIGVVTDAIKVIGKITSAIGSLLGLGGDEAVAATKKTTDAVVEATDQGLNEANKVTEKHDRAADALAKQKAAAAVKATKSKFEIQKDLIENALTEQKSIIDTANSKGEISDAEAKRELLEQQLIHDQKMLDAAVKYHQKTTQLKAQLAKTESEIRKNEQARQLSDAKDDSDELLADLEVRALKENMSVKKFAEARFLIEYTALANEIALRRSFGDDVSKLTLQLVAMELKHTKEARKDILILQNETAQLAIDNQKQALGIQLEQLNIFGKDTLAVEQKMFALEAKEEDARYADELEKRKEQGDTLIDEDGKLNALGLQLKLQHEQNLTAITLKEMNKRIAHQMKEAQFFAGPIVNGFTAGFHKMMKGAEDWTAKMAESNNVVESVFGSILQGFIQMIEGMIEKIIAIEAVLLIGDALFPGFSALVGGFSGMFGNGFSEGGIVPEYHASGGMAGSSDIITFHSELGHLHAGPKGTDTVNAWLTPGEEVLTRNDPRHRYNLPLSSGRSSGGSSSEMGFHNALAPVVKELSMIKGFVSQTRVVLPMNNTFENARNNYLKSEDRRSI